MADEIAEKSIGEAGKAAGAAASEGAASALRDDAFGDPNVLINRPEPQGPETNPHDSFGGSAKSDSTNDRFGDILINRPDQPRPETAPLDNKANIGGSLSGGDMKHGIVTTYDEHGNPTSDCNGPIPRPIGWPGSGKPGSLGGLTLPPVSIDFGPKK